MGSRALQVPGGKKNVLILLFDALSAYNMSLYGYARQTTPNIDRLAKRAIVYHNHHAAGNFTTPGTASILTGTYPWTHRAIQYLGRTVPRFYARNMFAQFGDYHRFAYTHNSYAYAVLRPMASRMDELITVEDLYLEAPPAFIWKNLREDNDAANVAWGRATGLGFHHYAYSLYLSQLLLALRDQSGLREIRARFPLGLPGDGEVSSFILETAIDWLAKEVNQVPHPFLAYVHFLPPHAPYRTRIDFHGRFKDDGFVPVPKPVDLFAGGRKRDEPSERRDYDEYILYADSEFGRLFEALETSGILEDTWLVLTSDHGELFERGLKAHASDALYQPEIRVPLLIFEPGRQAGLEIHTPTSAVDVMPTVAHITGHPIPPWTEGRVLPPYVEEAGQAERSVFSFMAAENNPLGKIHRATGAVIKGNYKLQYYFGYEQLNGGELVKLFDIQKDPNELTDRAAALPGVAAELLGEIKLRIAEADRKYRS